MVLEGWQSVEIGDLAKIQVGRDVNEDRFSRKSTDTHIHPVFSNTVEEQGLYGFYDFEEYQPNAVTVVGRGIGLGTAFFKGKPFGAIGRLLVLHPKANSFCPRYLTDYINHCLRIFNESGGIPQLPGSSLARYKVTIPPLPEQRKIADILSTWDRAIETTEALLTTAQAQKRALMQALLTGKRRFPEFEGKEEWREVRLGDVVELQRGFDLPSAQRVLGSVPIISSGGRTGFHNEHRVIGPGVVTGRYGSIGDVYYVEENFWPLNTTLWIKDFHGNDRRFSYYLLQTIDYEKYSDKTGVPGINRNDIHRIKVGCPGIAEQRKIAKTLQCSDQIIGNIQSNLKVIRTEKRALMQQLLSGKRRVVV